MSTFGNDRVAVLTGCIQVERVELVAPTQWGPGHFMAAKGPLLKI